MYQSTFPLSPNVVKFLEGLRQQVVHGSGFTLIQGLPVERWPIHRSAATYLAIGTIFGVTLSQNGKGHILGHVKVSVQCSALELEADLSRTSVTIPLKSIKSESTAQQRGSSSIPTQPILLACYV
jgi:hypothetical protein